MYEHRQRRTVAKKQKSAVHAYFEKGENKQSMNICREVKAHPREQAPEPTEDEVPLKIHSPLEERGSLRESVNYRKQDHSMITAQREIACYDVGRRKRTIFIFGPFLMQIGIALCTRAKRSMLSVTSHP
jgi:hypothetical protein